MYDLAIIGGGINGCGCAADASLRGLSVLLCEKGDLASQTSSKSSQLIHGGLRYLENFEFAMVRKALNEREKLLHLAPHLVRPLPFVMPYQKNMRPLWFIRAGLFLYDHLSTVNSLPYSRFVSRKKNPKFFQSLTSSLDKGFIYYDGATDDARLTISNALQAKLHGANIMPQTKLVQAEVKDDHWCLTLEKKDGTQFQIEAKAIINATGPWVTITNKILKIQNTQAMSLVKGSHMIVPKLYDGEHAYVLQNCDKRIVFTIPYHGFTMIGTTDVSYTGDLDQLSMEPSEVDYLCEIIQNYFKRSFDPKTIITSWAGVRPLLSDTNKTVSTLSRDYKFHFANRPAPSITIYGGKITTYRQLAAQAINQLKTIFPDIKKSNTDKIPLPGAKLRNMSFNEYCTYADKKYTWLDSNTKDRYLKTYGTRTEMILENCQSMSDLGECFTPTLYQAEVDYLITEEWTQTWEDLLWRRTKLGLMISNEDKALMTARPLLDTY